jgi:hypothetical protein
MKNNVVTTLKAARLEETGPPTGLMEVLTLVIAIRARPTGFVAARIRNSSQHHTIGSADFRVVSYQGNRLTCGKYALLCP